MKSKGFTLIELLVVIAIIGILATVVLSSLSQARKRARDTKRLSEIKQMQNALELYYLDNGFYPSIGGVSSTCPRNNLGGDWSGLTTALAPYMHIPQTDVSGNTVGFSGGGKCYNYNTFPNQSGICGDNSFSPGNGYCIHWENEVSIFQGYTAYGGSIIHRAFQPN